MKHPAISDLIVGNAFQLYGQPKWTFGKNTCNTYEVFVERIRLEEGADMPAWPVLELIEKDEALTLQFSRWFLEAAMRSAVQLTEDTDSNVTLSMMLLPLFANRDDFVETILRLLERTGLSPHKLQFELSEAQDLSAEGIASLNLLHDVHGVNLMLSNFGTGHSNIDLLREVHFDSLELTSSLAAYAPQDDQTCRIIMALQHFADALDLQVCVNGIDNQDQFEFFDDLGCYKGQGTLIGRAMPMDELRSYISDYAVRRQHKDEPTTATVADFAFAAVDPATAQA